LNAFAVQLMQESPQLARTLTNAQVLALGCTGAQARWYSWWLASTAAMPGALYVCMPSPVLALMLTAALVPGGLLLGGCVSVTRPHLGRLCQSYVAPLRDPREGVSVLVGPTCGVSGWS